MEEVPEVAACLKSLAAVPLAIAVGIPLALAVGVPLVLEVEVLPVLEEAEPLTAEALLVACLNLPAEHQPRQLADFLSLPAALPLEAAEAEGAEGVPVEAEAEVALVVAAVAMLEGVVYPKFLVALLAAVRVADCPRSLAALLATKVGQRLETR